MVQYNSSTRFSRVSIFLVLLFAIAGVGAQAQKHRLNISHLTGDFYIFTTYNLYKGSPVPANGMYVVTNSGVVMFDTPWDTTQFQPLMDSIQARHHKSVVICIATHSHKDKTAGLDFLKEKGVKTFTTVQTDEISKKKGEKRAEFLIKSDTIFSVGQYKFEIYYPGAGHTADNIVAWFDTDKILYGGCLVKSVEATDLGNLEEANVKEWPSTIQKLQTRFKNPRFVITGHQSWLSTGSLDHTLKLIKEYQAKTGADAAGS